MKKNKNGTGKILVSIINWNNSAATNKCLSSLLGIADAPDIIVIDNNSTKEALKIDNGLLDALPITIWNNTSNVGFAAAHNQSMRYALENSYQYVCLLNNDTELVDVSIFFELRKCLEYNPDAVAVAPTILSSIDPSVVWYAGGDLDVNSAKNHHSYVGSQYSDIQNLPLQETTFITGCCVLIRVSEATMLDEKYFLYWEDADWCANMAQRGKKLLYLPSASLLHHTSTSLGSRSPQYAYYNIRNHYLFANKWTRGYGKLRALTSIHWIALKYVLLSIKTPGKLLLITEYVVRALRDGKSNISGELKVIQ